MQRVWVASQSYQAAVERLISLREERSLSQRDLADRLGKPRSFVSKVETKVRRLDIVELVAYAKALGMTAGELAESIAEATGEAPEF